MDHQTPDRGGTPLRGRRRGQPHSADRTNGNQRNLTGANLATPITRIQSNEQREQQTEEINNNSALNENVSQSSRSILGEVLSFMTHQHQHEEQPQANYSLFSAPATTISQQQHPQSSSSMNQIFPPGLPRPIHQPPNMSIAHSQPQPIGPPGFNYSQHQQQFQRSAPAPIGPGLQNWKQQQHQNPQYQQQTLNQHHQPQPINRTIPSQLQQSSPNHLFHRQHNNINNNNHHIINNHNIINHNQNEPLHPSMIGQQIPINLLQHYQLPQSSQSQQSQQHHHNSTEQQLFHSLQQLSLQSSLTSNTNQIFQTPQKQQNSNFIRNSQQQTNNQQNEPQANNNNNNSQSNNLSSPLTLPVTPTPSTPNPLTLESAANEIINSPSISSPPPPPPVPSHTGPSKIQQRSKPHYRRPPLQPSSIPSMPVLDQQLQILLTNLIPSSSVLEAREKCRFELESLIQKVWPNAKLKLFGSSVNLLCDVGDCCVWDGLIL